MDLKRIEHRELHLHCFILIAKIHLRQPNPDLLLVSQELKVISEFSDSWEGSSIYLTSAWENRSTRFLKIENPVFPLYISTLDQTLQSSYRIIIEALSEERCGNDCSNHGTCDKNGCECYENYFGNDCSIEANEIIEQIDTIFYLYGNPTFFYFHLGDYQGETLELYITTNNQEGQLIFFQKTSVNYVPSSQDYNNDLVYIETVKDFLPLYLTVEIPEDIEQDALFVIVASSQDENFYSISATIEIALKTNSSNSSASSTGSSKKIIIIVVSITGAIIIITIYCIFKFIKRKMKVQETQLRSDFGKQTSTSPIIIQAKINYIEIQTSFLGPKETCSICLDNLVNGKLLNQTTCKHNFHQEYIQA